MAQATTRGGPLWSQENGRRPSSRDPRCGGSDSPAPGRERQSSDSGAVSRPARGSDRHPRPSLDGGPSASALAADAQKRRHCGRPSRKAAIAQARQDWRTELEAIAPERLVFLDESAALTSMVRTHAWSPRGTRAYGTIPCGHWTRLTIMMGALGTEGVLAAMSIEAATDGAV